MLEGPLVVELDQTDDWNSDTDWEQTGNAAVKAAFAAINFAPAGQISISINLSDNDEVQALNKQWRGKDKPTNVLSFPMLEQAALQQLCRPRESGGPWSDLPVTTEGQSEHQAQSMDSRFRGNDNEREPAEILLGDLILAHTVCATEAEEMQIPLTQHVTHLIIHGTLHLLGYDHIDDTEAEHMEALEVKALASLGLPNPY